MTKNLSNPAWILMVQFYGCTINDYERLFIEQEQSAKTSYKH